MHSVKSTQAAKRFGEIAQQAQHEVIQVTSHNRPYVMIVPVEEYNRLKRHDRQAFATSGLPTELVEAIEQAKPSSESAQYDHEL